MAPARKASSSMLMALLMVAGLLQSASAVTHTLTWTFATNNTEYDEWASRQNFVVGDEIAFFYAAPNHNVYEVNQADLNSCNLNNPIVTYLNSNEVVSLDRSGYFGFICGVDDHCPSPANMHMNVEVASAAGPASPPVASVPSTTPTTPPSVPAPPTAPTPVPPPTADASSLQTGSALVVGALVAACAAVFF